MLRPLALTGLSAVLYALSFPPVSAAPLVWVALVPLFRAITVLSASRAALCGALWGVLMAYGVGTWFPGMVSRFFEEPLWVGWGAFLITAILSASIYYAAFAAWVSAYGRRRAAGPLTVAAAWGVTEFARGRLLLANPWALAAYSQSGSGALVQLADATGPYGIGMLIAGVNATLAACIAPPLRGRRPVASGVTLLVVLVGALGYGRWRLGQAFTTGPDIPVGIVQGAIERPLAWRPEYQSLGVDRHVALTREAAATGARLIVWPEHAVSFYLQELVPERQTIATTLQDLGVELLLGGPHYEFRGRETVYHNSVFALRDGKVTDRYDKVLLLPLAEASVLGSLLRGRTSSTAGPGVHALQTAAVRVGPLVCWESMHPLFVRRAVLAGAGLLANLSNDSWAGSSSYAQHQLQIASMRAIENRRFLLRAVTAGYSAIVDPHGQVVAQSPFGTPAVLTGRVKACAVSTPYQHWGDACAWSAVAAVLVVTIGGMWRAW